MIEAIALGVAIQELQAKNITLEKELEELKRRIEKMEDTVMDLKVDVNLLAQK